MGGPIIKSTAEQPRINPDHQIQVIRIGRRRIPVLIIDDYFDSLTSVLGLAQHTAHFIPDEATYYPGVRSKLPKEYVLASLKPLMKGLYNIFDIAPELTPAPVDNYFSLVTKQPNQLLPQQTLPHFDTNDPNSLAVVHYLNSTEHGGTGFYRHNRSGIERVTKSNEQAYGTEVTGILASSDTREYCTTAHHAYTCIHKIPYKQNRLLLYPGNILHSALINNKDIDADPMSGRLTANMFIKFR